MKARTTGRRYLDSTVTQALNPRRVQRLVKQSLQQVARPDEIRQHWRGYVVRVDEDTFLAALGVISGEGPDIYANIYKNQLTPFDLAHLVANHFLEWKIGGRYDTKGIYRNFSEIRLIYQPPFTAEERADALSFAASVKQLFDLHTTC